MTSTPFFGFHSKRSDCKYTCPNAKIKGKYTCPNAKIKGKYTRPNAKIAKDLNEVDKYIKKIDSQTKVIKQLVDQRNLYATAAEVDLGMINQLQDNIARTEKSEANQRLLKNKYISINARHNKTIKDMEEDCLRTKNKSLLVQKLKSLNIAAKNSKNRARIAELELVVDAMDKEFEPVRLRKSISIASFRYSMAQTLIRWISISTVAYFVISSLS